MGLTGAPPRIKGSEKRRILYHKPGFLGLFLVSSLHRAGGLARSWMESCL